MTVQEHSGQQTGVSMGNDTDLTQSRREPSTPVAPSVAELIATELGVSEQRVAATIRLIDEGNTVPFIARYRKEITGGLDDSQLRMLETRLTYVRELEERKKVILVAIADQGKLSDQLRAAIQKCTTKARVEDLYLPFKSSRRTKATLAREAGLEPLVSSLLARCSTSPETLAEAYITEGFADSPSVLAGARAIVLEDISTNSDLVGEVRERFFTTGSIASSLISEDNSTSKAQKFRDYFEFSEPFAKVPSHRILALLRGESEGVLRLTLDPGEDEIYHGMIARACGLEGKGDAADDFRAECVRYGWRTKLQISSGIDVRMRLKERADAAAVDIFAQNLRDLLLAAPAGQRATLGVDPGFAHGVKCAVVDSTGKMLDTAVIYPHQPRNRWEDSVRVLSQLCATHRVELIAVGNGTASRETDKLAQDVADAVESVTGARPIPVIVSEAGASVYSASELAAEEFPELDVAVRGAVSIARRLQDPLAELVKIDPKSIGVGQYQHDVNQVMLAQGLDSVVEDAVNSVGVDVNTASAPLLRRVAGISPTLAENIVRHRENNGAFASRRELKDVARLGPKAFEQCAGFLRIHGASDPLDASAVHPETYRLVRKITAHLGVDIAELMGNRQALSRLTAADFADEEFGVPTVTDVLAELEKPGRDPRPEFRTATLAAGIEKLSDLRPGMVIEGTVTNVAAFGAFVDVGVHQDGLVHVSAMADRYIADPHDIVHSGQVVKVKVIEVDAERQRIGLSLRLSDDPKKASTSVGGYQVRRNHAPTKKRRQRDSHDNPQGIGAMAQAMRRAGFDA